MLVAVGLAAGCRTASGPAPRSAPPAVVVPADLPADPGPEPAGARVAVVRTERGIMRIALLDQVAPGHVKNFMALANRGFFDNLTFHRVVPGLLIQGGDPKGDGTGGPGTTIKAEFSDRPFRAGTVGMARGDGPDTAGSQWFIALQPMPQWTGQYTVFGQVYEGLDVAQAVQKGDRMLEVRIDHVPPESLPAGILP